MVTKEMLALSVATLDKKKAFDIKVLKIDDLTVLTEYFVIANATSNTHVHSLADEVEEVLKENGVVTSHIVGRSSGWMCMDYGSVIIHIFTPDQRIFYNLDGMWADGKEIDIKEFIEEEK